MNIPYTYLIKCIPTGQYYYGVRYAKNCNPEELWQSYFTSSIYVKQLIQIYGKTAFAFEIRCIFSSAQKARKWEEKVIKKLNLHKRTDFINKSDGRLFTGETRCWINKDGYSHFVDIVELDNFINSGWKRGRLFTKSHCKKIHKSKNHNGKLNPMFGKQHTAAAKEKMADFQKRQIRSSKSGVPPIPVCLFNQTFPSIAEAMRQTGLTRYEITKRISGTLPQSSLERRTPQG